MIKNETELAQSAQKQKALIALAECINDLDEESLQELAYYLDDRTVAELQKGFRFFGRRV